MKTKPIAMMLVLGMLMAACNRPDDAPEIPASNPPNGSTDPINIGNCGATASTPLLAGQHYPVGRVTVSTDGTTLTVVYEITEPNWGIVQTHLAVEEDWEDIPMAGNGNPIPGQFEFNNNHDHIIGYVYHVDVSGLSQVSIAAHCKVKQLSGVNPNPIDALVPGLLFDMDVDIYSVQSGQSSGFPYYLGINLSGSAGNGFYDGYCIDKGSSLSSHITYDTKALDPFVTSHDMLHCLGVDRPENMDLVAYLLNQYHLGAYPGADAEELQMAIWVLMEPSGATITTNEFVWSQSLVDQMLLDAANGEGFIPGLCQWRPMILDSKCSPEVAGGDDAQTAIVVIAPQECLEIGSETAWGFGPQFPGRNWGMYFNYCIQ